MTPLKFLQTLIGISSLATILHAPVVSAEAPHVRVARLSIDYVVQADGSYVETTDLQEQLNSEQAVHAGGQIQLPHSASLDELQVLEAYTLKRDGRHVPVPRTSIFVQDGLISPGGTTSYQDVKTTVIVFPEINPGDSIALRTRRSRRVPMLPGVFSYARAFAGDVLHDDVTITITAPKAYPLNVQSEGLVARPPVDMGTLRQWQWSYRNSVVERTEEYAVDPLMYRPRLLVSSARTYPELGLAARQRFQGKAAVTPVIRDAAREIVGDARTEEEQTRRIYRWVAKNVRYFAVVLGVGGYIPRSAEEVLASRFGDCKDHAVLLQALLAARGIASVPALLSTDPLYELPEVPVLEAFNHVIVHVPAQRVFLDANSPAVTYGVLPSADLDKPLLLLGDGRPTVSRTPSIRRNDDVIELSTRITVRPDGRASGEDRLTARGPSAIGYSAWADAISQEDPVRVARHLLLRGDFAGEGTSVVQRLEDGKGFGFDLLYELQGFADMRAPSSLRIVPPMDRFQETARSMISETTPRRAPYVCDSGTEIQRIDLVFPEGTGLTAPSGTAISAGGRSYWSSYRVDGNAVHIERSWVSDLPRGYCAPAEKEIARGLQQRVLEDLRAEIRYVPAAPAATVLPSRSLEEVQAGFDRAKAQFFRLYNRHLRAYPALGTGKVIVAFTIMPDGAVVDRRIVSSTFGNPSLEAEVLRVLNGMRFEARDVAPFSYPNYPLSFFPDAQG